MRCDEMTSTNYIAYDDAILMVPNIRDARHILIHNHTPPPAQHLATYHHCTPPVYIMNVSLGQGDLPLIKLSNDKASTETYAHGAHLTSWKVSDEVW